MSAPAKYRKRPAVIEAMQWDGTAEGATPIIDWVLANGGTARFSEARDRNEMVPILAINTIEGTMAGLAGWWIIRGVEGEFYPCKPSVFDATYEPEP